MNWNCADQTKGPVLACMKAVNDLNIPNLVPLEGDISTEVLSEKAGVEGHFLGEGPPPSFEVSLLELPRTSSPTSYRALHLRHNRWGTNQICAHTFLCNFQRPEHG